MSQGGIEGGRGGVGVGTEVMFQGGLEPDFMFRNKNSVQEWNIKFVNRNQSDPLPMSAAGAKKSRLRRVFLTIYSRFLCKRRKKIAPAALNHPKFVPEHNIDEQNLYRIREGAKKDTWERLQLMEVRGPGSSSGVVGTRL